MKNKFAPTTILALQAAIAMTLCFIIGDYFHLEKSYWAVLTALLLISQTWGESLKKAFERIGMTIFGGFVGTFIFFAVTGHPNLLFLIMLVTVFFLVYNLGHSFRSTAFFVTMFIVFLFAMLGQWNFKLLEIRIYETVLGALIAVLTSLFFLPTHAKSNFKSQAKNYLCQCRELIDKSFRVASQSEDKIIITKLRDKLFKSLTQLSETFNTSRYEMMIMFISRKDAQLLLRQYTVLIHYITSLLEASPFFHYDLLNEKSKEDLLDIQKALFSNLSIIIDKLNQKNPEAHIELLKTKLDNLTESCLLTLKTNHDISACTMHMLSFIYYVRKINEVLVEISEL